MRISCGEWAAGIEFRWLLLRLKGQSDRTRNTSYLIIGQVSVDQGLEVPL